MSGLPRHAWVTVAALAAACGPLDRSGKRALVVDETPLGTTRADVKAWHVAHDWCPDRTWARSDEYVTCSPQVYEGTESDRLHAFFRFEDDAMVAAAVYAPVACTRHDCARPLGVTTALQGPPFVNFDEGLVTTPGTAGRDAALALEPPADQRRALDALRRELEARHGAPAWTSATGTALLWDTADDRIGLFLSADALWTIETHERAAP